jgi:hypothetical protein
MTVGVMRDRQWNLATASRSAARLIAVRIVSTPDAATPA